MQPSTTEVEAHDGKRLSVEVRRLTGVFTASQRFGMQITAMRQLLKTAKADATPPPQMRELAKQLGKVRKERLEAVGETLRRKLEDKFEGLAVSDSSNARSDSNATVMQPVPLELFMAYRLDQIGLSGLAAIQSELEDGCGGDQTAIAYVILYLEWKWCEEPLDVLRRALLPILVSAFEEFLAALLRIHNLCGTNATVESAIKYANKVIGGSPQKWCKAIAEIIDLKVDIAMDERWSQASEVFARRNAIIHADGKVDTKYLEQTAGQQRQPSLGSPLVCDETYNNRALALLEGLADLLVVGFSTHFAPSTNEAAEFSMARVVRALSRRHWRDALYMADAVLDGLPLDHQHHELRVNRWMALKELGECDQTDLRGEINRWSPPDNEPRYRLAKACLLDDDKGAIDAFEECRSSATSEAGELMSWPLVEVMCKGSGEFKKATLIAKAHPNPGKMGKRPKRRRGH